MHLVHKFAQTKQMLSFWVQVCSTVNLKIRMFSISLLLPVKYHVIFDVCFSHNTVVNICKMKFGKFSSIHFRIILFNCILVWRNLLINYFLVNLVKDANVFTANQVVYWSTYVAYSETSSLFIKNFSDGRFIKAIFLLFSMFLRNLSKGPISFSLICLYSCILIRHRLNGYLTG